MPRYRRPYRPGGTFFFTVVTHARRPIFETERARSCLRRAIDQTRRLQPFDTIAFCLLPDHLHCIWRLPPDDVDFSSRWARIKSLFTRRYCRDGDIMEKPDDSRCQRRERAVWQRRFWEHLVRDDADLERHVDYIHYNPIKHGIVRSVAEWPWSTFHRYARDGLYDEDWGGRMPDWMDGFSAGE